MIELAPVQTEVVYQGLLAKFRDHSSHLYSDIRFRHILKKYLKNI